MSKSKRYKYRKQQIDRAVITQIELLSGRLEMLERQHQVSHPSQFDAQILFEQLRLQGHSAFQIAEVINELIHFRRGY